MKIVKIINSLHFGGIERVFEIVAKYYKGQKSDLIFIALGFGGAAEQYIQKLGYTVIVLHAKTRIPNFKLIFKLSKILKKLDPHVVHTCGAEANFHGLLAARIAGIPVRIGEEIGMPGHSYFAKLVFRFVYTCSSAVIVVAASVSHYLIAAREVKADRCRLIYNPVDVDRFLALEPKKVSDNFVLTAVCRLHPIKNLDRLIRVVHRLNQENTRVTLWLVGDGPIRKDLEKLVSDLKLEGIVLFHGFQPDPSPFLNSATAFILPSLSEGHPVSLIEAMIASVPAIVTKVGGAAEIIKHGENGWLIDPLNADSIYEAIKELMSMDDAKRNKVIKSAKEFALANFSPAEYFDKLSVLYRSFP